MLRGVPFGVCLLGLFLCEASAQYNVLTFHGDSQRTGWIASETILTPANVSSGAFGPLWNSPLFDSVTIAGKTYLPHLYASPLYVDRVTMSGGAFAGGTFHVVIAATSNGFVYAVDASPKAAAAARNGALAEAGPGTILWTRQLSTPSGKLDGGVPFGILSTPVIDLNTNPPSVYVTSADVNQGWQVFALDLTSGNILPGWPLDISQKTLANRNQNGAAAFHIASVMSQRGALNLSPDGKLLYVAFGSYTDAATGWMIAVDTRKPAIASAFSGAPSKVDYANAGMWASGGPAVDSQGNVYATTGNGTLNTAATPGYWGQSVLVWGPGVPLRLAGTYTPWNYCQMDVNDIDLSGGSAIVLPDLGAVNTSTPHLITFGGKQGNQYLVDRDHMPGSLFARPGCSNDPATDHSLSPPGPQPQFGKPGPLNVFGPYSEKYGSIDFAKGRSTGAFFRAADGSNFLFVTGSSKAAADSVDTIAPSLVKLRIRTSPGSAAYLSVEASENSYGFLSPGSPWVTSNASADAIVWVLVANVARTTPLTGADVPHPILFAIDPATLQVLWVSTASMLNVGGKYNAPGFGPGTVFVGTDRIQAFGLAPGRRGAR
jgi:hypothetical protein